MRRIIFMFVLLCALGVKAQRYAMTVHLTDGSSVQYENSVISKVEFKSERTWGQLEDGSYGYYNRPYIKFTFTDQSTTEYKPDEVEYIGHDVLEDHLHNGYPYVDLGLPSGLKWAKYNIGATAPEEAGWFMSWGETENKEEFYVSKYKFRDENGMLTKYNLDEKTGTVDNKKVLDPEDDVAHVQWGGDWRMPSEAEIHELQTYCRFTATVLNGVNVMRVTSASGNSIYLPMAGEKWDDMTRYEGTDGCYWSNQMHDAKPNQLQGQRSWFSEAMNTTSTTPCAVRRYAGCMVRAVFGGK